MPPCPSQRMQLSADSDVQIRKGNWGMNWEFKLQKIWQWICISLFLLYFSAYIQRQCTSQNFAQSADRKTSGVIPFLSALWGRGDHKEQGKFPVIFFSFSLQFLLWEVHSRVGILNLQCSSQRTKKGEEDLDLEHVHKGVKKGRLEKGIP